MIKSLYEQAHDYYKSDLKGQSVSTVIGDVHFSGKTWKKMRMGIKSDSLKGHLFMRVKDILLKGDYLGKTLVNKDRTDFIAFHFFMLKNIEIDGKIVDAGINVGEKENDKLVYFAYNLGHSLREDWKKKVEYHSDSAKVSKLNDAQLDSIIPNNEDDVNIYVFNIRDKKPEVNSEPPKGYVRVRNMLNPERIAIFRLASAKSKIETKEVGIIYIMAQNGEWYFVVPDLGTYGFGSKQSKKSLDEITKGIQNILPIIIK